MKNKKNYFAVIPAPVRYCEKLQPNAKLMFGEITALANDSGYCYASNEYFSKLYGVTKTSISKWISALENNNFIKIKYKYHTGTKQIKQRRIFIADPFNKNSIYNEKKLTGKYHLIKSMALPVGATFLYEGVSFNTNNNQFSLFIKLTKGASETPTVDVIIN